MSVKYTAIKSTGLSPKIEYFVSNQHRYNEKAFLLDLFTVASKPWFSLPSDVLGEDLISVDTEHCYDITDMNDTGMFFVPKVSGTGNFTKMAFTPEEIGSYKDKSQITQVVTGADIGKYHMGQLIMTPWGKVFTINIIRKYRHLKDHPSHQDMTIEQMAMLKDNKKFEVLEMEISDMENSRIAPSSDHYIYGVLTSVMNNNDRLPGKLILVKLSDDAMIPPYRVFDKFDLIEGMIPNYKDKTKLITTFGIFLLNSFILVEPFQDKIPYINSAPGGSDFSPSKIDSVVATLIRTGECGRDHYNRYMENGYFLGHMTQLSVPGLSKKSLTTDPALAKRKQELLDLHKDELDDPVVFTKIEQELISIDKAWIKGDSAERYYAISAKKSYGEHRKKMYIMMGISPSFVKGAASYESITGSLSEGYHPADLPKISNEIRRGSYDRGVGTAKGGEQTKFILRIFNSTRITEEDCLSKTGIKFTLTEANYKEYIGRYIAVAQGKATLLTKENIQSYIGKEISIRSPMHCKTHGGLCYTCCGEYFRQLSTESIGMLAVMIGSRFTSINMKSMHFSGIQSAAIENFNNYILQE